MRGLQPIRFVVAVVSAYAIGSVLVSDVVSRFAGRRKAAVDLRSVGSGNPGAANAMTYLGRGWGIVILAGDIAKGAAGAKLGLALAGSGGAYGAATAVVLGHCFPAWSGFKGGKGVATSAGTTYVVFPAYVPIDMAVIALSWKASQHAAKATYAACAVFVLAALTWHWRGWKNLWGPPATAGLPAYAIMTSLAIAFKFATAPVQRPPADDSEGA